MGTRVELFSHIRHDHRTYPELSIRQLATRHKVHRRTVRQALDNAQPPARKAYPLKEKPALGPYTHLIDQWLTEDLDAPRKQRHTSRRIWRRLILEHGAKLAETTVSRYVKAWKKENTQAIKVFVPQTHTLGATGECDFGEVHALIAGVRTKCFLFVMRLSASGKAFHALYPTCAQDAFLDGHVQAFTFFGGVPATIRYDNLKAAVIKVLAGRERIESDKFIALRSHYGFESFFTIPGIQGAHEKGGVEGQVGYFRRNYLVPVPVVEDYADLSTYIDAGHAKENDRKIHGNTHTIAEAFAAEQPHLTPLPATPFDACSYLKVRVDQRSRVCVRQAYYSVPTRFVATTLTVRLGPLTVEVIDTAGHLVASHARTTIKGTETLVLDHYLDILARKPGALPGATALAQARANGTFTPTHQRYWDATRDAMGANGGTKALIEVLMAARTLPITEVLSAMDDAVNTGVLTPAAVIMTAWKATDTPLAQVIDLPARLATYNRPAPTLNAYDQLLKP